MNEDGWPHSWIDVFSVDGRVSAVRVIYSGESGIGSIKDEPLTVVTAVMLNFDSQWPLLERDFADLPSAWFKRREIKGSRLLRDLRKARGKDSADALKLIAGMPYKRGFPIFCAAVEREGFQRDKAGLLGDQKSDWDAYDVAFSSCVDQVDSYLETLLPREKVLWIADTTKYQHQMKSWLNVQRMMTTMPAEILGISERERFVSHIADTIYFGSSHESRALQLADVCCSIITAHLLNEQVADPYYPMIQKRLVGGTPVILHAKQPERMIVPIKFNKRKNKL